MRSMTLETGKGTLYYVQTEDWKENADTIFFLHGLTADHTMFEEQFPFFEKEYNVLAWDAPGHGRSRPFEEFDFEDSSQYIKTILDDLNVKSVILAGQSLGGYFSQSFIRRYPDRVKAFISLDSTPYGSGYYSKADIWIIRQVEWMAHLYPFGMMKKAMAKQVSMTQEAYDNMLEMLEPYDKNELCHLMGIGYAGFLEDNCDLSIPCPVLLILGEHDRTGKVAQYNRAWAQRTGYPLKVIKGAAHNVNVDRPLEVNISIRDFLHGIDNASKKEE